MFNSTYNIHATRARASISFLESLNVLFEVSNSFYEFSSLHEIFF